jgi:competence protein ComEC
VKLPAVAIAASFAGGVALGVRFSDRWTWMTAGHLQLQIILASFLIASGFLLLRLRKIAVAAGVSFLAWATLGVLGASIAQQPLPHDHVIALLNSGRLDLHEPLEWHGTLRDEPARMPWGWRYDIALNYVEYESRTISTEGEMRVDFYLQNSDGAAPDLHAGDEISILTQAKLPPFYRDEGAFDRRAYLAHQGIYLVATLRAPELMRKTGTAPLAISFEIAHVRRRLRETLDALFAKSPQEAGILRAMLLGDRSFVNRAESVDFQKTGVFHVLVVAGLHVGAFAAFLFWLGRKLKFSAGWTVLITLVALFSYVAVIEQRPPVLRATLMAAIVILGAYFFRRLELLNSAAVAALTLLVASPLEFADSSFQLSFLAIGCIAGLGVPWMERSVQPYVRALRGWRDVTRDAAHEPLAAQFRIDLRLFIRWLSSNVPRPLQVLSGEATVLGLAILFRIVELLALTVVLQVGMLPLLAGDFHRVTLSAPIVNLFAVPITGVIVPLGFVTLVCAFVFPVLGRWIAIPLGLLSSALLDIVRWFAHFSRLSYRIPGPPEALIAIFLSLLVMLAAVPRWMGPQLRRVAGLAAGLLSICVILIASYPFSPKWSAGKLELSVLDVGQGDSLFLVFPRGRTLLIDGGGTLFHFSETAEPESAGPGPDPGEDAVSPYLWSRGFKRIDVVALTHAHQDHIGGLFAVLDNFHVGTLWIGREADSPALARLEREARAKGIPIVHELAGSTFSWGGVSGEFLWPEKAPYEEPSAAKNADSLVLHLIYGRRAMLLPGDAEEDAERQMLAGNPESALRSDVLKVGHHGSKNATSLEFLAAVHPLLAIISSGEDNPFGHPSPVLLKRLEDAHVRILRTDNNGAVHVLTDGKSLQTTCFVACPETADATRSMQTQPPDGK